MKHNDVRKIVILNDSHGVYIPKLFGECDLIKCDKDGQPLKGSILGDLNILRYPESILYWSSWECVLDNVHLLLDDEIYTLHQCGDLWAISQSDLASLNDKDSELFWNEFTF